MSDNVIRFDDYHPHFQGPRLMKPGLQFEVYSHGLYLGFVRMVPHLEAFGQHHSSIGDCVSVEQAINLLIAHAAEQDELRVSERDLSRDGAI